MKQSLIIHGPQGCGKTRNAKALAKHFGLSNVVELDGPMHGSIQFNNTLYLTNQEVRGNKIRSIAFDDAMRQAGLKVGRTGGR